MSEPRYQARIVGTGPPVEKRYITDSQTGGSFATPQGRVQLNFDDVHFSGVDFTGVRFWWFLSKGSLFDNCRFDRATFQSGFLSSVRQTTYRRCSFANTDLRRVKPGDARFEECVFGDTRFESWRSLNAEFVRCRFTGPLRDLVFFGRADAIGSMPLPERPINEFENNDFRDAQLIDVDFRFGIDVERQQLPVGQGLALIPDAPTAIEAAQRAVAGWPPGPDRDEAELWLNVFNRGRDTGLAKIWRPSDPRMSDEARAKLVAALGSVPIG